MGQTTANKTITGRESSDLEVKIALQKGKEHCIQRNYKLKCKIE